MPIIENFEKINQVHGYFFYGLLGVLFLIIAYIISWRVTKPFLQLTFERRTEEFALLFEFIVENLKQ